MFPRRLHQWLFRGHCLQPLRRMIAWLRIYPPRPYLMPRVCLAGLSPSMASPKTPLPHAQSPVGFRLQRIRINRHALRARPDAYISKSTPHQNAPTPVADVNGSRLRDGWRTMISKRRIKHQQRRHQMQGVNLSIPQRPFICDVAHKDNDATPENRKILSSTMPATNSDRPPTKWVLPKSKPTASSSKNTDHQSSTQVKTFTCEKDPKKH